MAYEQLKLENQVCFPLYSAARMVVRAYTPLLKKLEITYPQYLVLLVLWEHGRMTVNDIVDKLYLDTNTLTPLLQRLEKQGFIVRCKDVIDKRRVIIDLTDKGKGLEHRAADIPQQLMESLPKELLKDEAFDVNQLKCQLDKIVGQLALLKKE